MEKGRIGKFVRQRGNRTNGRMKRLREKGGDEWRAKANDGRGEWIEDRQW